MTWSHVACLVLGVGLGALIDDLLDLPLGKDGVTMKARLSNLCKQREAKTCLLWALAFVLAVNAGLSAFLLNDRLDRAGLTTCIVDYNQQFASAYTARLGSSIPAQAAQDKAFEAVLEGDREELRKAITDYLTARAKVTKGQTDNTYPALPDKFCGMELGK